MKEIWFLARCARYEAEKRLTIFDRATLDSIPKRWNQLMKSTCTFFNVFISKDVNTYLFRSQRARIASPTSSATAVVDHL